MTLSMTMVQKPSSVYILLCVAIVAFVTTSGVSSSFVPPGPSCTVTSLIPGSPAPTATSMSGSCQSVITCRGQGGVPIGKCGLTNVCCVFPRTCDSRSNQNQTYFTNPAYPSPFNGTLSCSLNVHRAITPYRICQLRLDFIDFELNPPQLGECLMDRMVISGQNANSVVPPICGRNTGQHIFVDIDGAQGPFTVRMITSGPGIRRWNIQISQVECANPSKAPPNCLQYYTGPAGTFSSFNYDSFRNQAFQIPITAGGGLQQIENTYFNAMDYAICFRKESGFCTMTYSVNTSYVPMDINTLAQSITDNNRAPQIFGSAGVAKCPTDYLLLDGIRFCGGKLSAMGLGNNAELDTPVYDRGSGPFIARFVSNERHVGRGFRINFQQNPCGSRIPILDSTGQIQG